MLRNFFVLFTIYIGKSNCVLTNTISQLPTEKRCAERLTQRGDKEQVAIRVDKDILAVFRATGSGWQMRLNAALREWLATHSHTV